MKKILIFFIVIFTIVLFACSQTSIVTEIPTSITLSPNQSLTPIYTWTPEPTSKSLLTLEPSETPNYLTATYESWNATHSSWIPTAKAQTSATRISAYTTLEAKNATCDDGYDVLFLEDMVKDYAQIKTTTDQWVVVQCYDYDNNYKTRYTLIANHDGLKVWRISYENIKLPYNAEFLSGSQADNSGNFLYLVPSNLFGPGGGHPLSYLFGSGKGLYSIDLESGELDEILGKIENGYYIDISMTSDSHYLAWSTSTEKNSLYLKDLINEKTTLVKIDQNYQTVGALTWSPDNKTIIFAASMFELEDTTGISLFRLNAETIELQYLLNNDKRNFVPFFNSNTNQIWFNNDVVNLASYSKENNWFTNTEWSINIRTGEVIPLPQATSTP